MIIISSSLKSFKFLLLKEVSYLLKISDLIPVLTLINFFILEKELSHFFSLYLMLVENSHISETKRSTSIIVASPTPFIFLALLSMNCFIFKKNFSKLLLVLKNRDLRTFRNLPDC